ncbi:telomere repeats-binding bouquet formation protein 1-like [Tachyglossus aculeatus]|uniref:telomere repeats-binding bouquet formation protein 1-like n=1 Tax=Tachyglossus aculeatus TaxID=9261 RepID=UPI0018F43A9D|nr:telomere repeats-binding bouquet formation protein 1-like [Tachyglossus aculeatus]XP_038596112.1 telomere repeats-binding bouquet formation protein 1-like [Tachyglossus aculeatus]XP_038596113.1 telomere repeats-binding bouquet formation protein 1-like [Tachyglossus aculeatus]XP_038596114.1 telomere repeats-binding bouquet formation protein 1-like [Tachyglossus aculeatus]XP_038596115.1 telomere repeats-binding bouquet formation protein 1-like [Tachyglossus aculeatus]
MQEIMEIMEAHTDLDIMLQRAEQNLNNFPVLQQSLLSIISICDGNTNAGVHFHCIGGLSTLRNLARSDVPSTIKEALLYTLGSLSDVNSFCQKSLCIHQYFEEIMSYIVDKKSRLELQMISVCCLFALVSKNGIGQITLRESGCFPVLKRLFSATIVRSEIDFSDETFKKKYHLWYAVCNTLSASLTRPRNKENQDVCFSILPDALAMIETYMTPEMVCPLCLFVGVTVSGNISIQKSFISRGGLDVLAKRFTKMAGVSHLNIGNAKMAVALTNAISVSIADNASGSVILAKYQVVPKLLTLLLLDSLNSAEKTSVLVTLGRCIESCGENLNLLVQTRGLKLVVNSFSEAECEDISHIILMVMLNSKIFAEKLLGKFLSRVSQGISELENQGKVGGHSKQTKDLLPKEQHQKKGNKDQCPKIKGNIGKSVVKSNYQEKKRPKQRSDKHVDQVSAPATEIGAQEPPKKADLPSNTAEGKDKKRQGVKRKAPSTGNVNQERTTQKSTKKVQKKK